MPTVQRDAVKLSYQEAGAGDPPMLLLHGWTCNRTHFADQIKYFKKTHRVVALDQRGHGRSSKPKRADYSIAAFADDAAFVCASLGLVKPVVVGHSMGGAIAVELGARHPELASAVVVLDFGLVREPDTDARFRGFVQALESPQHAAVRRQMVEAGMFGPADEPDGRARITDEMLATKEHVATAAMRGLTEWDGVAALKACTAPVLIIGIRPETAAQAVKPDVRTAQTVGSGHFIQVFAAPQVNAMIERFLATL